MNKVEIKKDVYWVGAVDWNVRNFHGHTYSTQRGTTYNSYLIIDDKVTLIDTVYAPFTEDLLGRISQIIDPKKIDYIVANHVETDHSGALPALMKIATGAKVVGTQKCKEGLYKHYYGNWDFQVVKTGDTLHLGKKDLSFIEAPMLHWPDSMFSYLPQEELLLPNDAFGQHYASSERFDDEVDQCALMDEAEKYYANILWPFSALVTKKIEQVQQLGIPIKIIAPSHGIIWRKDPAKIIKAYLSWASNNSLNKAVIAYETMWGSTAKMAQAIAEGLIASGITVKLFDIGVSNRTEVVKEMLSSRAFIIGSSTHDNDMLTSIAGLLEFVKGIKPKKRAAACFGSFGWAGGAVKEMEGLLREAGIEIAQEAIAFQYVPDEKELKACYEWGLSLGKKIKS